MKEINLAFFATGFMGTLYSRICHQMPGVNVVALLDIDPQRVLPLADELGVPAYVGDNYDQPLKEHPEIDAVVVATPEDDHVTPALTVLNANKHIMLEKPMTTSTADARKILAAAEGKDIISMVCYSLRFDPRYVAAKESAGQGDLGEVISIVARRNIPLPTLQRLNARVENPFWVGVHDMDIMRWITGSNVERVMAMVTKKGLEDWDIKGSYFALLSFDNGVIATLENTWAPSNMLGRAQPFVFKIEGCSGQVMVRGYESGVTVYQEHAVSEPDTVYMPTSFGRITGVYHDQMAYFVQCIREGKKTDIPLEEGLNGVMAAEAIIKSAEQHTEIVLADL